MKKLFVATLLTLLLAVNLFAANHTLNRISYSCSISDNGQTVGLQAIWADNGPPVPNPHCANFSYAYDWTVGDSFNSGTVLSVSRLSPSAATVEIYKPGPNCDCLDTTTTLTTVIETAPTACLAQSPYGLHFQDDCD